MTVNNMPPFRPQAVSVTAMAKAVGLSRTRFYVYVKRGVFPYPVYSLATHRPYYTAEMQHEILTTRQTGLTPEGEYVLFYERHPAVSVAATAPHRSSKRSPHTELVEGLKSLGLANVTAAQVEAALGSLYPAGVDGVEESTVLRTVYRHLRRQHSG